MALIIPGTKYQATISQRAVAPVDPRAPFDPGPGKTLHRIYPYSAASFAPVRVVTDDDANQTEILNPYRIELDGMRTSGNTPQRTLGLWSSDQNWRKNMGGVSAEINQRFGALVRDFIGHEIVFSGSDVPIARRQLRDFYYLNNITTPVFSDSELRLTNVAHPVLSFRDRADTGGAVIRDFDIIIGGKYLDPDISMWAVLDTSRIIVKSLTGPATPVKVPVSVIEVTVLPRVHEGSLPISEPGATQIAPPVSRSVGTPATPGSEVLLVSVDGPVGEAEDFDGDWLLNSDTYQMVDARIAGPASALVRLSRDLSPR